MTACKSIGCSNAAAPYEDFCYECLEAKQKSKESASSGSNSQKYPHYYKSVEGMSEIDVYAVHKLFNIQDPSGALQHASKKLLLSGVRTGKKSVYTDIREARDTLNRWLELHDDTQ